MAHNRAEILQAMLAQDPKNSLARYGLAMEFVNTGAFEQAMSEFDVLIGDSSKYVAAYFHGGQTLEKLGRVEAAREMYQRGIAMTVQTGDDHTRSELQAALDLL